MDINKTNITCTNVRFAVPKMMYNIQVLAQNGEIDRNTRNKMAELIKKAVSSPNPDFRELHTLIAHLKFSTTMPEILEQLRQLTTL